MAHEFAKRKLRYFRFNISEFGVRYALLRLNDEKRSADNGNIEFIPQKKYSKLSAEKYPKHLKKWYYSKTGQTLNLEEPCLFTEKIQWLKLHGDNSLYARLADKYEVRSWVSDRVGEDFLIPLLGVWSSFDEIDFDKLPQKFVLKCTHGSACNLVVTDKTKINLSYAKKKFDFWMNLNYAFIDGFELQYKDISPKIIAEQYLEAEGRSDLPDYKIHCFAGEPKFVQIICGRNNDPSAYYYDLDWNKIEVRRGAFSVSAEDIAKPVQFDKMIHIAKVLCANIPYVRVDLYAPDNNSVYFGEMTFTPASGIVTWPTESFNKTMGSWIKEI